MIFRRKRSLLLISFQLTTIVFSFGKLRGELRFWSLETTSKEQEESSDA